MDVSLVCPADHQALREADGGLQCAACGARYPVESGIARFIPEDDPFYEGVYRSQVRFVPRSERPWHAWPLWLINSGYMWAVRKHVPAGATVVELGGAGGVRYFAERYRMVACDISRGSLAAVEGYAARIQTDAAQCIPMADASVDAVVSSYFWEHMSPTMKAGVLKECARILRPGGTIVFIYDVETSSPLIRRYRERDPALYDRLFLAGDGHVGYESPETNVETFESAGFRVVLDHGMEKTWIQSASAYAKLAEFPGSGARLLSRLSRLENGWTFLPYTLLKRLVDTLVAPLLPSRWARIQLVAARRLGP
jgi:SAM-dependent methyltransferase